LTTIYQRITSAITLKDGFYYPKYSKKRLPISDQLFFAKITQIIENENIIVDEHELINQFQSKAKNKTANLQIQETNNLLFYHWYERKYGRNIINGDLLYMLNQSSILSWHEKFTKKDINYYINSKLERHFESAKFPGYTKYYEFFYEFFPEIENFSFQEFKNINFLKYLIEIFPKVVSIDYKNQIYLFRITDEELENDGDDLHYMTQSERNNSHNAITYNKFNIPCFYPTKIGPKNYDCSKIELATIYTPLFKIIKCVIRNIENEIRTEKALPKIGEGWISETLLFYKIKNTFNEYEVIHHGSPRWLGLQHFDIYFPELNLAIEYQGKQHQEPIEYFGGESAFKKNQERDQRKKRLCEENNCDLYYVYPEDDIDIFILELKHYIDKKQNK
jgi:hypothetical protein